MNRPRFGFLLALFVLACRDGGAASAPTTVPDSPGTVLRVNGEAVLAEEVDLFAVPIGALEPQYLLLHRRRLALTNVVLPLAALRTLDREAHARAREEATSAQQLRPAELVARASAVQGTFRELGLDLWCRARGLSPGEWSGPLELVGRFVVVRLDEAQGSEEGEVLRLRVLEFPFVPGELRERIEDALDRSLLEIVDPQWRETIPEVWQRRMSKP